VESGDVTPRSQQAAKPDIRFLAVDRPPPKKAEKVQVEQASRVPNNQVAAKVDIQLMAAEIPPPKTGSPSLNTNGGGSPSKPQPGSIGQEAGSILAGATEKPGSAEAEKPVPVEKVEAAIKKLSKKVEFNKFKAQVRVDPSSNKVIVSILSRATGEVVRQLPPEGILMLAEKLQESGPSGILLDDQV